MNMIYLLNAIIKSMETIKRKLKKHSTFFIIFVYLLINVFFMRSFWSEIFFDRSTVGAQYGEIIATEWSSEQLYKNIKEFKNPFSVRVDSIYPFGTDFTTSDSGYGFLFLLLRPFLSVHQSFSIIVTFELLLSCIGMYLLLKKLNVSISISFILGLAYGYLTFLMLRTAHLTYYSTFIFPWFYYIFLNLFHTKTLKINKIINALLLSIIFVATLFLNLYYFVMLLISIIALASYFLILNFKKTIVFIISNRIYFFISIIFILLFLIPWLLVLMKTYKFDGLPEAQGWGGAIIYSPDLLGYFVPSNYSYFLGGIAERVEMVMPFLSSRFESFVYPGLIILFSYLILGYLFLKNKMNNELKQKIKPFLIVSFIFWSLSLGPFLHVFGKWGLPLDEGIRVIIPLPYVILHYIPFLGNIRAPARLIVAFIFFAYIVSALFLNYIYKNKGKHIKLIFFAILFFVFVIDHYFIVVTPEKSYIPLKAYKQISKDSQKFSVLQLPFMIRDGFISFGDESAINIISGQMIHQKPIIGGYLGRISQYKHIYYMRNPFLGYIGRLFDKSLSEREKLEKSNIEFKILNMGKSMDSIDFLNIKYVVLDTRIDSVIEIKNDLELLGFSKILTDGPFILYVREISDKEFIDSNIGKVGDEIFIFKDWSIRENDFRYSGLNSGVMFKVNRIRSMNLSFKAKSYYNTKNLTIYMNNNKIANLELPTKEKTYSISAQNLKIGINIVLFKFDKTTKPLDILKGSTDDRNISAIFKQIKLIEK